MSCRVLPRQRESARERESERGRAAQPKQMLQRCWSASSVRPAACCLHAAPASLRFLLRLQLFFWGANHAAHALKIIP